MAADDLRLDLRSVAGDMLIAAAHGEVSMQDRHSRHAAEALLASVTATPDVRVLVLDLSAVDHVDSSGLSMIVRLWRSLRAADIELRLVAGGMVRHRLDITAITEVIRTDASAVDACQVD